MINAPSTLADEFAHMTTRRCLESVAQFPCDLSRTIYVDCDDMLFDWTTPFGDWYREKTGGEISLEHIGHGDIVRAMPGHSPEEISTMVREFNLSDVFGRLPFRPGASEFIDGLRKMGFRVHPVTACSTEPGTKQLRIENLHNSIGADMISDVSFVELGGSKTEVLSALERGLWLDDSPKHVHAGILAGHHGMLVASCTNLFLRHETEHTELPLIDHLPDLLPALEKMALEWEFSTTMR
jgi:hypothetical protein